ncbi:MAG: aldehyde dehydrogenase family protein, partial [Spirochaetaceae bacterium]
MELKKLYVDGEWIETGDTFTVVNPGTKETLAEVASADREVARRTVAAAERAFPSWRRTTGMKRGDYLLAVAECLTRRKEEIARTVTQENGKPLRESRGEVNV